MAELKQYIFFDFEMLCSNTGMTFASMEAIRLGAVKFDIETEEITTFDRFIKPTSAKPLSEFCKDLTGIHDRDLKDADDFKMVFEEFLTWVGGIKKSRFFSWSPSDIFRLKADASIHEISESTINKIEKRYVDFQAIFTKRVSKSNVSVETALHLYDLQFIGEKHNPMFDAYNTLRIYINFLNQPVKSDLIMVSRFIFENDLYSLDQINTYLNDKLRQDLHFLIDQCDIYPIKSAKKLLKRIRNLVNKYSNILVNRSGVFSYENISLVQYLVDYYYQFLLTYNEHTAYSSKILILDDYLIQPVNHLYSKQG
ncbi:exonuclease domain-containing protein [Halalkalibacter kiskunsagensis]|uniref:Exonuclease domain-containing protein n=1 Tax=Halalkalibacter kiskunsagensis TaxID=1548599 RepID=A0ABV6KER1_9BACI